MGRLFAVLLMLGCGVAAADWTLRAPASAMPIRPGEGTVTQQANPDFSWPLAPDAHEYTVEVQDRAGRSLMQGRSTANWYSTSVVLRPGNYQWRVVATARSGSVSATRWLEFSVADTAKPFVVPAWGETYRTALSQPRPRTVPGSALSGYRSLFAGERRPGWNRLVGRVRSRIGGVTVVEPARFEGGDSREYYQWMFALPRQLQIDFQQIEEGSLVWLVDGDREAMRDAKRRMLALAALDPNGATAYEPTHHPARNLLWALTVGFDRLYAELSEEERTMLLKVIDRRFGQIEHSIARPRGSLESMPYDSHGFVALHALAAVSAVMAGHLSQSEQRFSRFIAWFLNWPCPWGREEGGFANGTAYASWDAEGQIAYWDAISHVTNLRVYDKPWFRNHPRFFAYFAPPGAPSHLFGDGAERHVASYVTWALASRIESRESQWLLAALRPEDASFPIVLTAPAAKAPTLGVEFPASLSLPDIGWVAMHSRLMQDNRTSLYFKSSPYGSVSHNHADQNSFVLDIAGRRVLADGGYYDWYGSPHRKQWYETTRAHNAITIDGGRGQRVADKGSRGRIAQSGDDGAVAYAVGDATPAYGGALTLARRTLFFARPGTILVIDQLASTVPRTFEWNLHSQYAIRQSGAAAVEVAAEGGTVCIRQVAGPGARLRIESGWPAAPEGSRKVVAQWRSVHETRDRQDRLVWAHAVSTDCNSDVPRVEVEGMRVTVWLGGQQWTVSADGIVGR